MPESAGPRAGGWMGEKGKRTQGTGRTWDGARNSNSREEPVRPTSCSTQRQNPEARPNCPVSPAQHCSPRLPPAGCMADPRLSPDPEHEQFSGNCEDFCFLGGSDPTPTLPHNTQTLTASLEKGCPDKPDGLFCTLDANTHSEDKPPSCTPDQALIDFWGRFPFPMNSFPSSSQDRTPLSSTVYFYECKESSPRVDPVSEDFVL